MRIAFLLGGFPHVSETFILRQITGLVDLGHDVDIFAERAPGDGAPLHPEVARYGLLAHTVYVNLPPAAEMEMPVWPLHGRTWTPGAAAPEWNARRIAAALPACAVCIWRAPALAWQALRPSEFGYQAASLSALYRLAALCRNGQRYDVLHAHFGPVADSFRMARSLFRAPLVVSFHGYDFTSWPRENGPDCYRRLWRTADCVTVNSDYTGARVRELGCPPEKTHRLPVGLDPGEFPFRERTLAAGETVRILTVARLVEKKGYEYSLRAVALARRRFPKLRYTIAGDGPLRGGLEALVRELDLAGSVEFTGAVDGLAVRRLMSEAHIFLLGSVTAASGDAEGQGLVLQEAQACGLPVVTTRHGPFPEGVVEGESALLAAERDAEALADRLACLIAHPERWPAMGRKGRQFVERNYDIRALNRRLSGLYRELEARFPANGGSR